MSTREDAFAQIVDTPVSGITLPAIRAWFSSGRDRPALVNPNARVKVDAGRLPAEAMVGVDFGADDPPLFGVRYAPNWKTVRETTPGRVVANALVFARPKLRLAIPYQNKPWDKGVLRQIQQDVVDAAMAGLVSVDDVRWTVDTLQWLGYAPTDFMSPSININVLRPSKKVRAAKKKLLREHAAGLEANDVSTVLEVEKQLLNMVEEEQAQNPNPAFDIYRSGARGSLGNNGKNTFLMRGAVRKSDDPSQIRVSTASLEEGIPKDEFHVYADLIVQASYGRSVMTREGGYLSKQLVAAFQSIKLNPDRESDCGVTRTVRAKLDPYRDFRYPFVRLRNGTLVELTEAVREHYAFTEIELRSPLYCQDFQHLCSRCAGTLYYRLGIENIGLLSWRVGSVLLNASLKSFHDTTIKQVKLDFADYVREVDRKSLD